MLKPKELSFPIELLPSYVRRVRALISAKAKIKRVERSMDLQEWLKENPNTVIIFSDKKIFTGELI